MHVTVAFGLLLALISAIGASLSGLWKQKGAVQTREVDIRHPWESALALFRSKWFVVGWIGAVIAWVLHVGALALAPISLGQAVISGGIVSLGLIAERFFDFKLQRRQWIGLALMGLAMVVLGVTSHSEGNHNHYSLLAMGAFELGAVVLGVAFAIICRVEQLQSRRGVLLGVAGGILFGVADVSIKAVTGGAGGALATTPWAAIGALCGIGAFYATARSLQIGDGVGVIAATASSSNLLGILGGILVFGDPLGNDGVTISGRVLAFVLAVAAVGLVPAPTRAHAAVREDEHEKDARREQEQHKDEYEHEVSEAAVSAARTPAATTRRTAQPAPAGQQPAAS